ncbi:glycosyltransferase family 4 protein [Lachnospiraceae bacterium OM04-12BH]|nr:glycosyltransferase family 4 protein [Lachnospiraceae bacterium OM04-12BH]
MKIMFIIPRMVGGGAERVISVLANEFVNRKIGVKILMTSGSDMAYKLDDRIEVIQIGERSGGSLWKRIIRIIRMRKVFRNNPGDILVAFEPTTAFFACLAKMGLKRKLVSSERNDPKSFENGKIREYAYRHSDKVVFQTKDAMMYFPEDIQKKGIIIANPITENLPEVYTGKRKHTVVAAGRLVEQKNHVNLFYAFRDFLHHYPDYVLHLYGQGELEQDLRELAEKLNIKESVIFEGFHENILNEIKDAGMYVLSSDYEGISNSLLEAMAMGMPVISTDCPSGGSKMCIQNGVNGILVPVAQSGALAAAMEKIASSEDFAIQIGKEATKVRDRFSMQNIVEQWIELLTEL